MHDVNPVPRGTSQQEPGGEERAAAFNRARFFSPFHGDVIRT